MSSTSWQWVKANPDAAALRIRELERENAALREDKERLDSGMIRLRAFSEWGNEWCIHTRLDLRAAVDAARAEEGQRCQCTKGVIRSVGRDNDEVIEDCPNCSGSKEAKP